jgi:hypothetical protein
MQGIRDQLLADAALALEQHCNVGRANLSDAVQHAPERWTIAENAEPFLKGLSVHREALRGNGQR